MRKRDHEREIAKERRWEEVRPRQREREKFYEQERSPEGVGLR